MSDLRKLAERAFLVDDQFARDREKYKTFDAMPKGLQLWWIDRASAFRSRYEAIASNHTEEPRG